MPLNDSSNSVSTATSTGSLATDHLDCPTAGPRPSDISSPRSKSGWMRASSLTRFIWAVKERAASYLNTKTTPCYSNSDGSKTYGSDIRVEEGLAVDASPRDTCVAQQSSLPNGSGSDAVVERPQGSLHRKRSRSSRNPSHSRSQSGSSFQTFLDVSVQLTRTVHWKWKNDSEDQKVRQGTRFSVEIDPEITRWLNQRNIKYKKSKVKIICPRLGRPCWEIFLQFRDIKEARYFASAWNAPSISADTLKAMIQAARQKSQSQWR